MAEVTKQELREAITKMFVFEYLPKVKKEVCRFNSQSYKKMKVAEGVSGITGTVVGVQLGELKIADPTNELIDKIVEYVEIQTDL